MKIYLGLGSNEGNRRHCLEKAVSALSAELRSIRISPVVETPALLPSDAPDAWNLLYLNCVLEAETDKTPQELLEFAKKIEGQAGRIERSRWAPRPLDIDLLLYGSDVHESRDLMIPHPEIHKRDFVLTPLLWLAPHLVDPRSGLTYSEFQKQRLPIWMGIVNITPDSFSDGGVYDSEGERMSTFEQWTEAGVQIFDIGAESTAPGATLLDGHHEWERLEPVFEELKKSTSAWLKPWVSIDTRRASIARRALASGANIVNDVSAFSDQKMWELAHDTDASFIAMHSLGLPADRSIHLPLDRPVITQILEWGYALSERWKNHGLKPERLWLDPGIGFGKTPFQSMALLRDIKQLSQLKHRVVLGHSRKSVFNMVTSLHPRERDWETLGSTLKLCEKGAVDIFRVHAVEGHMRAYRSWIQTGGWQ